MCTRNAFFKQAFSKPLSHVAHRILLSTLSLGVLHAGAASAYAADYSVLQAGLGGPGIVAQKVLRYALVRNDLNGATLKGAPITSAALAGGYLAFEQLS